MTHNEILMLNCFSVKDQRKGLLPDSSSTQNQVTTDEDAEEVPELLEETSPEAHLQLKAVVLNSTNTAALDEVFQTAAVNVAVQPLSNKR